MVEEVKKVFKDAEGNITTVKTTKTIKKATTKKKKTNSTSKKTLNAREREQLLIENFAGLQKAMMNLSIKFETLSDNISNLLNVFELSAKDYVQRANPENDKELIKKLNSLLDQNKTIAKGLVLIEEKVRHRTDTNPIQRRPTSQPSFSNTKPLPRL